jgi:hypothetical protein
LNFNRLIMLSALFIAPATTVLAKPQPTPTPSGIVVHLFGPDSITSNILPAAPGQNYSPARTATGTATGAPPGAGQPAASAAQATDYPEPSWHDVLHQMFITGDPENPPKLAPGRAAERP